MADRFEGYGVPRAFACVIRDGNLGPELLVFDHPEAGTQIPKGRIDPGEEHQQAARRELTEESGLELEPRQFIGHHHEDFLHPETGTTVGEEWYLWLFHAPSDAPDSWSHVPEEESLVFSYRWIHLDGSAVHEVHPHFEAVVKMIEQMFGDGGRHG